MVVCVRDIADATFGRRSAAVHVDARAKRMKP